MIKKYSSVPIGEVISAESEEDKEYLARKLAEAKKEKPKWADTVCSEEDKEETEDKNTSS